MVNSELTSLKGRIDAIDVLRGFALAGILYAHMVIWYTGAALPTDVYTRYNSAADGVALGIFGALVFGKFFSVFSFLFGLSFFLHFQKKRTTSNYLSVYVWRLFLLFLIGLVHHLFWRGDILAIYAILGSDTFQTSLSKAFIISCSAANYQFPHPRLRCFSRGNN